MIHNPSFFLCPVCHAPLLRLERSYCCPNRHSFDCSKYGYVNLLLDNAKNSKLPGDNKEMIRARKGFLEKGYYFPLVQALQKEVSGALKEVEHPVLLDAGCGEGYYTYHLSEALRQQGACPEVFGVDISKFALQRAGRRLQQAKLAVASVFHLPLAANSIHALVNLFAPCCPGDFHRVLREDGHLFLVIPDREHLWELKTQVYEHPYPNEVKPYDLDGFTLAGVQKVASRITLENPQDIGNLFSMTPYSYRTSQQDVQRLRELTTLHTRIQFQILHYVPQRKA